MKIIATAVSMATAAAALLSVGVLAADQKKLQQGHEVFDMWCAPCHSTGPGNPGTTALETVYQGAKPGALEQRSDLTPEIVSYFVRNGVSIMPFFRKTEISDAELEALAAYLSRNLPE